MSNNRRGVLKQAENGHYTIEVKTTIDLGTAKREEAERLRARIQPPPAYADDAAGVISYHEAEIARLRAHEGGSVLLGSAWNNYAATAPASRSSTTGAYFQRWGVVQEWAEQNGVITIGQITESLVDRMTAELGAKYAPTTVNGILNAAKVITGATTGRHGRNPFDGYQRLKGGGRDHRPFTEAEIDLIFARAHGEVKTACYLMLYSGQRAGDVGSWEWSRVDFDRGTLWCKQHKTGRRIELPMHQTLSEHLRSVRAAQRPEIKHVMPCMAAEQAARPNHAAHTINRFLASLGMKSGEEGIVGSHSFRYYFVSLMREKNVPDGVIQELVGHSTKAMLHRYSRIGMEARARAVAELPPISLVAGQTE
jgi:integrase